MTTLLVEDAPSQRLVDTFKTLYETDAECNKSRILKFGPVRDYAAPAVHIQALLDARQADSQTDYDLQNADDLALLIEAKQYGGEWFDLPSLRFFAKGTEKRALDLIVLDNLPLALRKQIAEEGREQNALGNEYCIVPATMKDLETEIKKAYTAKQVLEAPNGILQFNYKDDDPTHAAFAQNPYSLKVLGEKLAKAIAQYIASKKSYAYIGSPTHEQIRKVLNTNNDSVVAQPCGVGPDGILRYLDLSDFSNNGCSRLVVHVVPRNFSLETKVRAGKVKA